MPIHEDPHPTANTTVPVLTGPFRGEAVAVEDWWDRVGGRSWRDSQGTPAGIAYAARIILGQAPDDDDVLYGKISGQGTLLHQSEITNS